eukprot:gene145-1756_t
MTENVQHKLRTGQAIHTSLILPKRARAGRRSLICFQWALGEPSVASRIWHDNRLLAARVSGFAIFSLAKSLQDRLDIQADVFHSPESSNPSPATGICASPLHWHYDKMAKHLKLQSTVIITCINILQQKSSVYVRLWNSALPHADSFIFLRLVHRQKRLGQGGEIACISYRADFLQRGSYAEKFKCLSTVYKLITVIVLLRLLNPLSHNNHFVIVLLSASSAPSRNNGAKIALQSACRATIGLQLGYKWVIVGLCRCREEPDGRYPAIIGTDSPEFRPFSVPERLPEHADCIL